MESPSPCPDIDRLRALLAGELPIQEETDLSAHLDQCPRCQQRLEKSAGGTRWLPAEGDWDPADLPPAGPELREAMDMALTTLGKPIEDADLWSDEDGLDFLDPTTRPGFLGRLGPYDVEELLGRGGMGIVLKAHDPLLNRRVAVKVLAPELAADPAARVRFLREAQTAAAVEHDHLVTIHAVAEANRLPHIVMEFVDGPTLAQRIDQGPAMPTDEIVRIAAQVARGLAAAHGRGLIHRDIKPANILLDTHSQRAKIADFGLARTDLDVTITQTGTLAGTPQYMAPEQAAGEKVDQRTDLYSFGGVLYAMCSGRPPVQGRSFAAIVREVCDQPPTPVRTLNPETPPWLADVIDRLLAKAPDDRYQTAAEVADVLADHVTPASQPTPARSPQQRQRAAPATGGRRRWPAMAGAAMVLLAGVLALSEWTGMTSLTGLFPGTPKPGGGPAEPAGLPENGFIVYANGADPRPFPDLQQALAVTKGGETIEIRWDGIVPGPPVRPAHALTLRAAEGFQPVFETDSPMTPCILSKSPLVLEGLTFRLIGKRPSGPPPRAGARPRLLEMACVVSHEAPLHVAHCRFLVVTKERVAVMAHVAALASPTCELRNCLLSGVGGAGVRWAAIDDSRMTVRQCAFAGVNAVSVLPRAHARRPAVLRITKCTIAGREGLQLTPARDPLPNALRALVSECVFEVDGVVGGPGYLLDQLTRYLRWTGERNCFSVRTGFVVAYPPAVGRVGMGKAITKELAGWEALWKGAESGSRKVDHRLGKALAVHIKIGERPIQPPDFAIKGETAGVTVETLGPGAPYDRWRKTAEYKQWRSRIPR